MRLNKYLSDAGFCSRREADRLIEAGRVQVDGRPAVTGMQIDVSSLVCVDGKEIRPEEKRFFWYTISQKVWNVLQTAG